MEYRIRNATAEDYPALMELWQSIPESRRALTPVDDTREGISRYLERNPSTSFVAQDAGGADGRIIGAVLAGHDGRRGIIHHMAVAPGSRWNGIASTLVRRAEDALKTEGIKKILILVFRDNDAANAFWERHGYTQRTNLNYRNKSLSELIPPGE